MPARAHVAHDWVHPRLERVVVLELDVESPAASVGFSQPLNLVPRASGDEARAFRRLATHHLLDGPRGVRALVFGGLGRGGAGNLCRELDAIPPPPDPRAVERLHRFVHEGRHVEPKVVADLLLICNRGRNLRGRSAKGNGRRRTGNEPSGRGAALRPNVTTIAPSDPTRSDREVVCP